MHLFIEYFYGLSWGLYLGILSVVGIIYYFFLKFVSLNVLDPLMLLGVFASFSTSLVFYMFFMGDISAVQFCSFLAVIIPFWIGYLFAYLVWGRRYKSAVVSFVDDSILKKDAFFFLLVIPTLVLFWYRGVPILSENPSDAKVLFYANGFGAIRYFHFIIPAVLAYLILAQLFAGRFFNLSRVLKLKGLTLFFMLLVVLLVPVLLGSKGALLFVLGGFSIIAYWYQSYGSKKVRAIYFSAVVFVLVAAIFAVIVSILTPYSSGNPLISLAMRFLASGDVFFFYYGFDISNEFEVQWSDFLAYIFDPLLAFLGAAEHSYPLGAYVLHYSTGWPLGSFGPNAQLPVLLNVYFGSLFSAVLALAFGLFVGFLRMKMFVTLMKVKFVGPFFALFLWASSASVLTDLNFFVSRLWFVVVVFVPILFIYYIVATSSRRSSSKWRGI